nr:hypothetical protein [Tanacetum cinerariifolium]
MKTACCSFLLLLAIYGQNVGGLLIISQDGACLLAAGMVRSGVGWYSDLAPKGRWKKNMTPPKATLTVSSTYEIGGPSTIVLERPSSPLPAPGLPVPPTVIEDLGTQLGNLEYRHGVLTRKMEEVSDAEVAGNIAIGEIHPRVSTVKEQVQVMESQAVQVCKDMRVTEMESHVGVVMSHMLWMEERLTVLENRFPGPPPGPQ